MTVLNGQFAISPQGGYVNANVTRALRSVNAAWIGWPVGQWDIGVAGTGYTLTRVVAAAHPRALNGQYSRSYMDDYYYRVHVRPQLLALGNLSTAQQRSVEVWNAYPDQTLTLSDTDLSGGSGIEVTAPGALPMTFTPLRSAVWQVGVGLKGPSRVNATLTWLFGGSDDVTLLITGQRVTAWTVLPDWADGITETLAWSTDAPQAVNGAQQRTPLRAAPRRQWEFPVIAYGQDRQIAESLLYDASARVFALPVWTDVQWLGSALAAGAPTIAADTDGLDFAVGSQAMLWQSALAYELVEISAIASGLLTLAYPTVDAWPAGTRLYPCRLAALTDWPSLTRNSSRLIQTPMKFEAREQCDWPSVAPTAMYKGYPVLETHIEETDDPSGQYARATTPIDNDIGLPDADDVSGLAWMSQSHAWLLHGRAVRAAHRSLLYWLDGRVQALWVPSWNEDLTLAGPLYAAATSMDIVRCGVAFFLHQQPGRRNLRIELTDGTVFYRGITGATEGATTEEVSLDSALGVDVQPDQVRTISWMMLATQASDSVEIDHLTDSVGIARCATSFAGIPAEEPA